MDADERAQRDAENTAAALHHVGPETGAGATVWARAAQDLLKLHRSARERYAADTATLEVWERLHGTALMLAVAIDQVLAFERRVRRLTGDAELARARAEFDQACPDAQSLRDLVAHLDSYAVGEGWRQTGHHHPPISEQNVATFIYWTNGGSTILDLGGDQMNLNTAAAAAVDLARWLSASAPGIFGASSRRQMPPSGADMG